MLMTGSAPNLQKANWLKDQDAKLPV